MEVEGRRIRPQGNGEGFLPPPPPPSSASRPWNDLSPRLRRIGLAAMAIVLAVASAVALSRFDGLHATDAATGDSTRWFVDQSTRRLALIDGYSGTTLARLHPGTNKQRFNVVEGPSGAFVLYYGSSEARSINDSTLELGEPTPITELTATHRLTTVTRRGLAVIDADTGNGTLFDKSGVVTPFGSPALDNQLMSPDGALWGLDDNTLVRLDGTDTHRMPLETGDAELSLVGDEIIVLDRERQRVRFGDGDWIDLPTPALGVDAQELVLQEPGPADECGWVAAHDAMFCVSANGIERSIGLEAWVAAPDRLAISGAAAVIVTSNPPSIVQFDPATGKLNTSSKASVPADAVLEITSTDGLVWIEELGGKMIWSANQWTIRTARKDDERAPLLGTQGETIAAPNPNANPSQIGDAEEIQDRRLPDNNGIDDPPVAVDDVALVRSGASLPLIATANDYDPDGEAVVIENATSAVHGSTTIASATTISYQSEPGFEGTDTFEYTIVDGDGDVATATVTIEVVGPDHPNEPPAAISDWTETVAGVPVVLDVLANDYDPERDALQIKSESQQGVQAEFRRVVGASGLEAIEVTPDRSISQETVLQFTYKAQDAYGAVSGNGTVTVKVRPADAKNLPPVLEADGVRAPRLTPVEVPVLANDSDPDGDSLSIVQLKVPQGLDARIDGKRVVVTAKEAASNLETFSYTVDDQNGHKVTSTVLVLVEPAAGANRPPVAVPDVVTTVAGQKSRVKPLTNDYDPDGDEVTLVGVGNFHSDDVPNATVAVIDNEVVLSVPAWSSDTRGSGTFDYQISDGRGHTVTAVVTVTIIPKALDAPPNAVDDSADTQRNQPVTIYVLINDSELSGQEPTIIGDPVCPNGGKAETLPGGRVRFTPPKDEIGIYKCTYRISNPQGLTSSAVISITVVDDSLANRPPEPKADVIESSPGKQSVIMVLANDVDPDGDTLTLDAVEEPGAGSARKKGNSVVFRAPQEAGLVSFAYQVSDGNGGVSKGQISVKVRATAVTNPLVAFPDAESTDLPGNGRYSMDVLSNDQRPTQDPLTLESVVKTEGPGGVSVDDGRVLFTFGPNARGQIVATYTVRSIDGQRSSATASLNLLAPAKKPVAERLVVNIAPGKTIKRQLVVQSDDPSSLSVAIPPDKVGGVTVTPTGGLGVMISADPGATGATVPYVVTDARNNKTTSDIVVKIASDAGGGGGGGGSTPSTPPGGPPTTTTPPTVPCEDVDAPDVSHDVAMNGSVDLFVGAKIVGKVGSVTSPPKNIAKIKQEGNTWIFTAAPGVSQTVTFGYTVVSAVPGCDQSDAGTVSVEVNRAPRPIKNGFALNIPFDGTRTIAASELATDDAGEELKIRATTSEQSLDGVAVTDNRAAIYIDANKMKQSTTRMAVTVEDPGGRAAQTIVTINRSPREDQPAPLDLARYITTEDLTGSQCVGAEGWTLVGPGKLDSNEVIRTRVLGEDCVEFNLNPDIQPGATGWFEIVARSGLEDSTVTVWVTYKGIQESTTSTAPPTPSTTAAPPSTTEAPGSTTAPPATSTSSSTSSTSSTTSSTSSTTSSTSSTSSTTPPVGTAPKG